MGKPSSQTVTQNTAPPSYVSDAQQNLLKTVGNFTAPFTSSPPDTTVAGFTPDQNRAFDISRWLTQRTLDTAPPQVSFWNPDPAQAAGTIGTQAAGPAAQMTAAQSGPAALAAPGMAGPASLIDPATGQVTGASIQALMNPYTSAVLDPTIAAMRRQLGITQNQIGAQNASSAAFGGSRAALQSAEANRAFSDQAAQVTAQLMAQGYDRATATALANAANAQQAGQFNAGAQNQIGMFNAGNQQQANLTNAAAQNQLGMFNTTALNNAAAQNTGAANDMSRYNTSLWANAVQNDTNARNSMAADNANRTLSQLGLQNQFMTDDQRRQLAALTSLLSTGAQQQQN